MQAGSWAPLAPKQAINTSPTASDAGFASHVMRGDPHGKTVTGTSCLRTCSRTVSWSACGCAAAMSGLPGHPHFRRPTVPLSAHRLAPKRHSERVS